MNSKDLLTIMTENDFLHNILVVNINKSAGLNYDSLSSEAKYECTKKAWTIKKANAEKVDYVIAKYNGVLKEIYKPEKWKDYPIEGKKKRCGFEGKIVTDLKIRNLYIGKKLDKNPRSPFKIYKTNK